jgi:hypothetical protein
MFTSFNSFSSSVTSGFNKTIKLIIQGIVNGNFNDPVVSGVLPGWTLSKTGNINHYSTVLVNSSVNPASNSNLPAGSDYVNYISFQSLNATSGIFSQTISLNQKQSTLSFYASLRSGSIYSSPLNVFSLSIGGTTLATNVSTSSANWTYYSYTYTPPSSGQYVLSFTITNPASSNDSTLNIANITIV